MRIAVAGAGIAGSCATRILRERGHDVVLFDPHPDRAASRLAFAVTRTSWWSGSRLADVRSSLDWYRAHDWIVTDRAEIIDVRRNRASVQNDHYLINPVAPLADPDLSVPVTSWNCSFSGSVSFATGDGQVYPDHDALILACGPDTGSMIPRFSGVRSWGGIFAAPGNQLISEHPLALLRRTDRLSYTACYVNGETRIGASRRQTPEQARTGASVILDMLTGHKVIKEAVWEYRSGVRFATPHPGTSRISSRIWALTGFARSGYSIAPAEAMRLADELEKS